MRIVLNRPLLRVLAGPALVVVVAVGVACGGASSAPTGPQPIPVLGAENFYADVLSQIGGPHVRATSILSDPNVDPHAYEPSPKAAAAVAEARIVIVNGIGYDDFMQRLLGASAKADRIVIDVQQLLGLGGDVDPHVWYDPKTMPAVARAAASALAKLDPQDAAYFAAQQQAYLSSLTKVDDKIAQLKAAYRGAPVAFTEPVAAYQAAAIGLAVLTPPGFQKAVENGTDPAPADVAAERDLLTGKKVKVLLLNSQATTPLTDQMRELAVQNGIPVVGVAETMPPTYRHYQDWMLGQLDELAAALAKGP